MKTEESTRRNFIKASALGIGSLGMATVPAVGTVSSPADKKLNILCVGAHPGDPEFGCGGTLAKYSDAGHAVTIVYLTRGEAGDPTKSFAESAALRTREAEVSCKVLKAKALFAGQVDGNTELNKERNEGMMKLILSEKPDVVFAHWPLDTHGDHQVAGLLTLNAWVKSGQQFHLYFYEVNTGDETMGFVPTDYVDISAVRDRKKAAMFAHQTQNPESVYDAYFKAMEDFRGLESRVKAAEGFIHFKPRVERASIKGL
jgi:LmbE family N-acetylglucosaminyl deacetylase